jgi:hypothetical protein
VSQLLQDEEMDPKNIFLNPPNKVCWLNLFDNPSLSQYNFRQLKMIYLICLSIWKMYLFVNMIILKIIVSKLAFSSLI